MAIEYSVSKNWKIKFILPQPGGGRTRGAALGSSLQTDIDSAF